MMAVADALEGRVRVELEGRNAHESTLTRRCGPRRAREIGGQRAETEVDADARRCAILAATAARYRPADERTVGRLPVLGRSARAEASAPARPGSRPSSRPNAASGIVLGNLAPAIGGVRLTLHVLAATVWVGGQITVAGLLPTLRSLGGDAPRKVARAFGRIQWPAYAVLVATGIWNVAAVNQSTQSSTWNVVLGAKIGVVALAGLAAFLHQRSASKLGLALWGAIAGVASLGALGLGAFLAG